MGRKINTRQPKQLRKRVIGAGITEFWYLKQLKPLLKLNFELYPRLFGNESMENIKKRIEEGLNEGTEVICLFDEDVKQWNEKEKQRIKELHQKYDNDARVTLGCSMPSIEYWFLLHYENTNRHLRTSLDAIKALKKYKMGLNNELIARIKILPMNIKHWGRLLFERFGLGRLLDRLLSR